MSSCGGSVQLNPTRSTATDPGGWQGTRVPAVGRVVAVGDVHGDLSAVTRALRMARLIDKDQNWVGGTATLVQVGDLLDRGDDERAILVMFERLRGQATRAGGRVITLIGNHEVMNAVADFRYTTSAGFNDFEGTATAATAHVGADASFGSPQPDSVDAGRRAAFAPGGPWARRIARFGVIAIVGDTLFAHGGVLPAHITYGLNRINRDVRMWLLGDGPYPQYISRPDSPVWTRLYASRDPSVCEVLDTVLKRSGAKRMVVAHTVQRKGVTSACAGRLWRIDVGMSRHYGGKPAGIEIVADKVSVIDSFAGAGGAAEKPDKSASSQQAAP